MTYIALIARRADHYIIETVYIKFVQGLFLVLNCRLYSFRHPGNEIIKGVFIMRKVNDKISMEIMVIGPQVSSKVDYKGMGMK